MPIEVGRAGVLEYSENGEDFKISGAGEEGGFSFEASYSDRILSLGISGENGMNLSALYSAGKSGEGKLSFLKGEYCPGSLGYSSLVLPVLVETFPEALELGGGYCSFILKAARGRVSGDANYSRAEDFLLELESSPETATIF